MTHKYYPHKGKWTIKRFVRRAIEANGGEMPVEELLDHMKRLGYLKEPLRRRLSALDVEISDDGMCRLRYGGGD